MLFFEGETKEEICNLLNYVSPYTKNFVNELQRTLLCLFLRDQEIHVTFVNCKIEFVDKQPVIDFSAGLKWVDGNRVFMVGGMNWHDHVQKMTINT